MSKLTGFDLFSEEGNAEDGELLQEYHCDGFTPSLCIVNILIGGMVKSGKTTLMKRLLGETPYPPDSEKNPLVSVSTNCVNSVSHERATVQSGMWVTT